MRASHFSLFALCFSLFLSCSSLDSEYPLNTPGQGLLALRWGMPGDSAMPHMMTMEGVTLKRDTVITAEGGFEPMIISDDSVEVNVQPLPPRSWRYVDYEGGSFMGSFVREWSLVFTDTLGLADIYIRLVSDDRNKRRLAVLEQDFSDRYVHTGEGPWGPMGRMRDYWTRGLAGSSDTTEPADTYVTLVEAQPFKHLQIMYHSRARIDADKARREGMEWVRMGKKEWEERQAGSTQ